jgi:hypothetical protein
MAGVPHDWEAICPDASAGKYRLLVYRISGRNPANIVLAAQESLPEAPSVSKISCELYHKSGRKVNTGYYSYVGLRAQISQGRKKGAGVTGIKKAMCTLRLDVSGRK